MPNFKDIGNKIFENINKKNALYLGVGHRDEDFSKYLTDFLKKLSKLPNVKNIIIFAEIDEKSFVNYCAGLDQFKNELNDFNKIYQLLSEMLKGSNGSVEFLAFLLTLHLSGIKIIPFNYVPRSVEEKEQNERAHNILYGSNGSKTTMEDLYWASAQRVSGDKRIAEKIIQDLSNVHQDTKYIIIGGPAHVEISKTLQIDAINVMSVGLYKSLLLGSHPNIIQNLCSDNVVSFAYEESSIKQVYWGNASFRNLPASVGLFSERNKEKKLELEKVLSCFQGKDKKLPTPEVALRRASAGHSPIGNTGLEKEVNIVEYLANHVNDIDACSPTNGMTALHHAIVNNKIDNVKILLAVGARFDIPDKTPEGKTAYQCAEGKPDILELLSNYQLALSKTH